MADRCIRWERPYASTGQGHSVQYTGRPSLSRSALAYDPEKDTSSGFENTYTAEVEAYGQWGRWLKYRRTLWRHGASRADDPRGIGRQGNRRPRDQDRSMTCPESVATERSCRRALDRDVAAHPPRITLHPSTHPEWGTPTPLGEPQRWFDKIAPAGPWECVEHYDE